MPEAPQNLNVGKINLARLAPVQKLDYTTPVERVKTYYSCNVDFVNQEENKICWAACIACLSNYLNDTSLTAIDVAKKYWGDSDYNRGLLPTEIEETLNSQYELNYTLSTKVSDNLILENIMDYYPVYGLLWWIDDRKSGPKHACIVYGVNPVSGYITVMDPFLGFSTAYSENGEYSYYNPNSKATWALYKTISRYT